MALIVRLARKVGRLLLLVTGVVLADIVGVVPHAVFAAQHETVVIKNSSIDKNVVLVNGLLNGKLVQLECFLSVPHCKVPKEGGDYLLVKFPSGEGPYMDCPNVHLYDKSNSSHRGQKIGDYCLLGNE